MNQYFDAAFYDLMFWEGGDNVTSDEVDAGGTTKYGISLRFIKNIPLSESDIDGDGHVTERDIRSLTSETAKAFYRKYFWLHYQLGNIDSEPVAVKLLNIFVNMRGRSAGRIAQRALKACGVFDVKEDGYLGPLSFDAINELTVSNSLVAMYLAAIRSEQAGFYRLVVQHDQSQKKFLTGWLNRAYDQKPN